MVLNPYSDCEGGTWLRGNLHTHTTNSDGQLPMQEVVDRYAALGHDFLMISDHDRFTGADAYHALDAHGMVLIPGNEVTAKGPHILQVGGVETVSPVADRQVVLHDIHAQGALGILCHPDWEAHHDHFPYEALAALTGATGMEIFNGSVDGIDDTGSPYALDKWDRLLSRPGTDPVWGLATDDSHRPTDIGLGWIVACCRERSEAGILEAIRAGCFFASSGVEIARVDWDGEALTVQAPDAECIVCTRESGTRVASCAGPTLRVAPPDGTRYLRVDCFGGGEARAWTQPIFLDR